jgi:hypothetical protein
LKEKLYGDQIISPIPEKLVVDNPVTVAQISTSGYVRLLNARESRSISPVPGFSPHAGFSGRSRTRRSELTHDGSYIFDHMRKTALC